MKHIVLFVFMFLMLACKSDGTDTGNPSFEEIDCNGQSRCMPTPIVGMQISGICDRINQCFAIDFYQCFQEVKQQTGLGREININVDTYDQLQKLYSQKKVSYDHDKFNTCGLAISQLSCDSSLMQNSIQIGSNNEVNFSSIHLILSASTACREIYYETP